MKTEAFEVNFEQEGERLDKFLSIIYPDFSRSFYKTQNPFYRGQTFAQK